MPDQNILREFLVRLGFEVDDQRYHTFNDAIERSDKVMRKLDIDMIGAIESIGLMIETTSRKLSDMYLIAQSTGTPVKSIDELRAGFRMVGLSAEDAEQAITTMYNTFASKGGIGGGMEASIGAAIGYKGDLNDLKSFFMAYIEALAKMPQAVRDIMAGAQMGWSPDFTERMVKNIGVMEDAEKRRAQVAKEMGVDMNKAGADAREFDKAMGDLHNTWDMFLNMLDEKWLKDATGIVKEIDHIIEELGHFISTQSDTTVELETFGAAIIGIGVTLTAFRTILAGLGLAKITGEFGLLRVGVLGLGSALGGLVSTIGAMAGLSGILSALFPWAAFLFGMSPTALGNEATIPGAMGIQDQSWEALKKRLSASGYSEEEIQKYGKEHPTAAVPQASQSTIDYFMKQGWTREQATAITANLARESYLDPNARGDNGQAYGVGQWHPDRQRDFAAAMGKSIQGSSLQDQLAFVQYELTKGKYANVGDILKHTSDPRTGAALLSGRYEMPKDTMGEAVARANLATKMYDAKAAGNNVTINQDTDINVNSTGDPHTTATAVAEQQDRVHGNMARQFAPKAW
jgi:hypothetical protein